MSEAIPRWQGDNAEITGLLGELELQIEDVTARLSKIRGTVARISYAALTAPVPVAVPSPAATPVEAVDQEVEPAPVTMTAPLIPAAWHSTPAFNPEPDRPEIPPEPGFWDSVAEGASWPRSRVLDAPLSAPSAAESLETALEAIEIEAEAPEIPAEVSQLAPEVTAPAAEPAYTSWMTTPLRAEGLVEALKASGPQDEIQEVQIDAPSQPVPEADQKDTPWGNSWQASPSPRVVDDVADEAVAPSSSVLGWPIQPSLAARDGVEHAAAQVNEWQAPERSQPGETADAEAPGLSSQWQAVQPEVRHASAEQLTESAAIEGGPAEASPSASETEEQPGEDAEPAAEEPAATMPSVLSFGWPDESIWSQSFEWGAMKPKPSVPARREPAPAPMLGGVSDIVAQVRAELEAARGQEPDAPPDGDVASPAAGLASGNRPAWGGNAANLDAADLDAASAAVQDAPSWTEPAEPETSSPATGNAAPGDAIPAWTAVMESTATAPAQADEPQTEQDDATKRDEVSRAVEEGIRRQMDADGLHTVMRGPGSDAGPAEKPAFRLAAPGSIPDWSHMQVEPSGPPVVVMKDAEGRVELASVYETLNELGCGDGAALLNYTPHSVTVGLPTMAQFPSPEQMAEAVEKVFGLRSRVESDGVRITVSIGEDPKQRSVGAA